MLTLFALLLNFFLCITVTRAQTSATAVKLDAVIAYVNQKPIFESDLSAMTKVLTYKRIAASDDQKFVKPTREEALQQLVDYYVWRNYFIDCKFGKQNRINAEESMLDQLFNQVMESHFLPDAKVRFYSALRQCTGSDEDLEHAAYLMQLVAFIDERLQTPEKQGRLAMLSQLNTKESGPLIEELRAQYKESQLYELEIWKIGRQVSEAASLVEERAQSVKRLLELGSSLKEIQAICPTVKQEQRTLDQSSLPAAYVPALEAIQVGDYTDPLPLGDGEDGYHIIHLKSRRRSGMFKPYSETYHLKCIKKTATPILKASTIKKQLEAYKKQILSGEITFEEVAASYSDEGHLKSQSGDMGWLGFSQLQSLWSTESPNEVEDGMKSLLRALEELNDKQSVTPVIQLSSEGKFAILKLVARRERDPEEVLSEIIDEKLPMLQLYKAGCKNPNGLKANADALLKARSNYLRAQIVVRVIDPSLQSVRFDMN